MPLVSTHPSASSTDGASRMVLVLPPGAELPSGFPFSTSTVDSPDQLLRQVITHIDSLIDAPDDGSAAPLVLALPAKSLEFLLAVATPLQLRVRVLSGLEAEYAGYWSILSSALPNTSIAEVMDTRKAEDHANRSKPASRRDAPKDFEASLGKLKPPGSVPDEPMDDKTRVASPTTEDEVD